MELFDEIAQRRWKETEKAPEQVLEDFDARKGMNEKDILSMRPGRELNIIVAKHVMGHDVISDEIFGDMERLTDESGHSVWDALSAYSEDGSVAQQVVQGLVKMGYEDAVQWELYGGGAYTPAEAICKRALLAIMGKRS